MGLTPLDGRTFEPDEYPHQSGSEMPVVLSEALARQLFDSGSAVGRRFELEWPTPWPFSAPVVVIGVVGDARSSAVRREAWPTLYHPGRPSLNQWTILVRSTEPPARAMDRVREVVRRVEPRLPITKLEPLQHQIQEALAEDRALAQLSGLFALLASVIAITGVGALVWQLAIERRYEFAIRLAVGASGAHLVREVLEGALKLIALGFAAGFFLYWLGSSWIAARLFGVEALDSRVLAASMGAVFIVTLVAALLPAARATRVDPWALLRTQ